MSHAISLINASAAAWADTLLRACWQGGLGIALVWLLCRLWPALPASARCWLWRLAYAKLLLGLLWLPPLALPLLPAPKLPAPPPVAQGAPPLVQAFPSATPPVQALPDNAPLRARATEPTPASFAAPPVPLAAPPPAPAAAPIPPLAAAPALPPPPTLPTVQTWLLAAWLLGVLASLGRVATAWRRACALSRAGRPMADEALQADAADLSRRLGLRRVPPLHVADGLASPLLLGLGRPTILLPAFVVSGSPRPELRLMLAHELAHLARRDLWWNALPLLAQRLFFFHPLVWLAGHEWALAQEIACDTLAVQTTGTPPSAYARMLLGIATRRRTSAASLFPTLAVAAPRHTLRRRLHAMQHIGTLSRPRLILAAALTALLAVGGLLPWRVVAQTGAAVSTCPIATQQEEAWKAKEETYFASEGAKADAQFAEILKHASPAQLAKVQPEVALITAEVTKDQRHLQTTEQHRKDYLAAHPNRLSDAQTADITKLLDLNIKRNDINAGVAWRNVLRGKLLVDLSSAHDVLSKQGYQRQISTIDRQRLAAEREVRALEPLIAQQKARVSLIPDDQRKLMAMLRHYDVDISCGITEALMQKQMRIAMVRELLWRAGKPQRRHSSRGVMATASLAPPQAKTASFEAVAIGGPPPLRLAQSVSPPSVPSGVAHTEAKWEELERKQHADIDSRNAQADAQLAEIQKHLPPAQLKAVQSQIAFANAEYAKEQKRVQISEQSRAAYIASHPNQLSDAQIAFIQEVNWAQMHHSYISRGVRAELAAIPKDQRNRVATLRSYDGEISGGRMMALIEKQAWVEVLRQRIAGKGKWPIQPRHASTTFSNNPALGAAPLMHDAQFVRGGVEGVQPNHSASAPVRVSPVMAEALDKQIARLEKQSARLEKQSALSERQLRIANRLSHRTGAVGEGAAASTEATVIAFLKARRAGAAWALTSIASPEFSPGLKGQQLDGLRRFEQQAQQDKHVAEKYAFRLAVGLIAQESRRTPLISMFSEHGSLRVRIFSQDANGRHLILDKLANGKNLIIPSMPMKEGSKLNFFVYDDGKQIKEW